MPDAGYPFSSLQTLDDGSLGGNAAVFRALQRQACEVRPGNAGEAAFRVQLAGHYAWMNHPGVHGSLELERAVSRLGFALADIHPNGLMRGAGEVVHVLTQALEVGGHTRLARRWIEVDRRQSSVVLTAQGWHAPPRSLLQAAAKNGGSVIDLGARARSLVQRGLRLRQRLAQAQVVILHTHPFDVVPLIALGGWTDRPPVVFMNHADHAFWLGASCADLVVNFRRTGAALAEQRRGVHVDRLRILPLPIDRAALGVDRRSARATLGIPDDSVVVLTVASEYKLRPADGSDYLAEMTSVVEAIPRLRVLVAGPRPVAAWAEVERSTGGRLRALGLRSDLPLLHTAADAYVDSFPASSLTGMLEAGAAGLPILRRTPTKGLEILHGDSPGLDEVALGHSSLDGLAALLRGIVDDEAGRLETGRRTAGSILEVSSGEAWIAALDDLYTAAASVSRNTGSESTPAGFHDGALDRRLASLETSGTGLRAALAAHARYSPVRMRPRVLLEVGSPPASLVAAVPDWVRTRLRPLMSSSTLRGIVGR